MGVIVKHAGLLTTVQDSGRWGYQHLGVPVAGAMDIRSHRLANLLVGNDAGSATLEVTVTGPELWFDTPTVFAVTGAAFELQLDGEDIPPDTSCVAEPQTTLTFGQRRSGARAYLAVAGGFEVPVVLGSRSTHIGSGMGGLLGRALRVGDRLEVGGLGGTQPLNGRRHPVTRLPAGGTRVRVILAPHVEPFSSEQVTQFQSTRYRVSSDSDRMGYRLSGAPLKLGADAERISTAVPMGAVQIPRNGAPIVLMADHQTTGGYPRIATVISADLPVVAQLVAGDWLEFQACTHADALGALIAHERVLLTSGASR